MRLTHIRVTNFKSIEDSGEFSVGDVTCLVGKNEAGKTALLQALHRLNPDSGGTEFDVEASYPRRFLSEYGERHPTQSARVLETRWQLDDKEVEGLKTFLGPKGVSGNTLTITKSYKEGATHWATPINEASAVEYVISKSGLHAEERAQLAGLKTIDSIKQHLNTLGAAATDRHKALIQHLAKYSRARKRRQSRHRFSENADIFLLLQLRPDVGPGGTGKDLRKEECWQTGEERPGVHRLPGPGRHHARRHGEAKPIRADDREARICLEPDLTRDFHLLDAKQEPQSTLQTRRRQTR